MAKQITRKRKVVYIILGSLLVILVAFRIALPYILLKFVNRELAKIDGYYGHVRDIDVALIRGAYTIKDIRLDKTGGKIPVPFFSAPVIDISIEWRALFNGAIVGEIVVEKPMMNFVKGPTKQTTQTKIDKDWTEVVDKLLPLKLNRLEINNGEVHYRDYYSKPKVDIFAKKINILAQNLSNAKHAKDALPSTAVATADVYGGTVNLNMKLDPVNRETIFDANAELKNLNLVNLNDFLKAYGNFDVSKGNFNVYTEAAANDGKLAGYVKPLVKDLKVLDWKDDKDQPIRFLWEAVVSGVAWVFKNHPKDQLATKVEFTGDLKNPDTNIWEIIGQILRNAFIQALYPSLENEINLQSVKVENENEPKTFMGKLFKGISGKGKKNKKEKKAEK